MCAQQSKDLEKQTSSLNMWNMTPNLHHVSNFGMCLDQCFKVFFFFFFFFLPFKCSFWGAKTWCLLLSQGFKKLDTNFLHILICFLICLIWYFVCYLFYLLVDFAHLIFIKKSVLLNLFCLLLSFFNIFLVFN